MRWTAVLIGGVIGTLSAASPVGAQIPESPGPPPGEPSALPYVIAIVMLAVICAAAMKSAKRSHQD